MNKKFKYPILAKPSGITLEEHQNDVLLEGKELLSYYPFTFRKYQQRIGKRLERRIEIVTAFHDDGKQDEKWQLACQMDYENYLKWKKKYKGSFQEYASKNQNEAGMHLRMSGVRHEFHSLNLNEKKKLPICLQAAIAAHHGKLGFKFEDRWNREGVGRFWKAFQIESNRVIDEKMTLSEVAKLHYEFAGPRGLLQLSDHRASAKEDGELVPGHKPFTYKFPHFKKRNVQRLIEQYWQDDLLLIRAATGAGKTDAALLWASKQIENDRAERLVIAMPTRFTSNALAINVAENLSDTGLYHSSAWFNKFHDKVEYGQLKKKEALKEHEFARLLQTPITVCTIDHLLTALTLTREDHHLIAFNLANSCIVIDEADFYDDFTQANILVLLEILKYWEVPVLLMSASLPENVLPEYKKTGYKVTDIKEDNLDQKEYGRERLAIKSIVRSVEPSDIESILELCLEKGSAIIYANTIDRAIGYLNWFDGMGFETCLYHSRFTEPDKVEKEKKLIRMLGRKAWENGMAQGIAILTQIGEMSINISADFMISDLCPIDRLIQRVGRLCRFEKLKLGELHLLIPEKEENIYPAPYGSYDRQTKSWMASEPFQKTKELIACRKYSTQQFNKMLNQVYKNESEYSAIAVANANNLREYFKLNWLINSKQISGKEDTGVNFWKSRDIPPQETIFVKQPKSRYFNNYLSFQNWKIQYSVEVPVYLIEKGIKNHIIDMVKIIVNEEEKNVFVIREGFYSFERGANMNLEDQFL